MLKAPDNPGGANGLTRSTNACSSIFDSGSLSNCVRSECDAIHDWATCVRFAGGLGSDVVDVLGAAPAAPLERLSSPLSSLGRFRLAAAAAEGIAEPPLRELGAVTAVDSEERRGAVRSVGESRGRAVIDAREGG